jgi:MarR family transcriptional regulator for hemolysin
MVPWEDASLPLMLSVVRSRLKQVALKLLAPYGVTYIQFQMLRALFDSPGICHGHLAGALGLDKPTTTRVVQTLQRKGWVTLVPHAADGRKVRLDLSASGRELVESLAGFRGRVREAMEEGLSPEERRSIRALLLKIKTNLDRLDEASGRAGDRPR